MTAPLEGYRVIDLTDEKGFLCGKILADLGMDVIKVETPRLDSSRIFSPFASASPDSQRSLYWIAYNMNKRSTTLDLENQHDRDIFKKLVKTADFVIESFYPGYLDELGLGYDSLSEINPSIIMTSVTPFGQTGPYRKFKGDDLVCWGMGGILYMTGSPDRPPVQFSFPQAYFVANAYAAAASLIAHYYRLGTGEGQYIDVSIQECVRWDDNYFIDTWLYLSTMLERAGEYTVDPQSGNLRKHIWQCKDGYVMFIIRGGDIGSRHMNSLAEWMEEEKIPAEEIRKINLMELGFAYLTGERFEQVRPCLQNFFLTKSKMELFQGAIQRHVMLFPILTPNELLSFEQFRAREIFRKVEQPQIGSITVPVEWAKFSLTPCELKRPAPAIGEHNEEILKETEQVPERRCNSELKRIPLRTPLEGINILEFGAGAAGPLISTCLAEYGATVIRIESMAHLDFLRVGTVNKDRQPGVNRSALFNRYNPGKWSFTLNLRRERAQEIVNKLIQWADIIIESFAPGVMARNKLDYENVIKIRPDIIMLSSTNLGQTGPYAGIPGMGWDVLGVTGLVHLTGWPDRPPDMPYPAAYSDYVTPPFGVAALIAALDYKRRTGKGQYIDISQLETTVQGLIPVLLENEINGREIGRMGNRVSNACPHGIFRTRDNKWCIIATYTEEEWRSLVEALAFPEWAKDKKFCNLAKRKENEDELEPLMEAWTVEHSFEEIMLQLQKLGIHSGIAKDAKDVYEDPQLNYRGFFKLLEHPEIGELAYQREPFILSKTPGELHSGAPCLGEHNELVCVKVLGLSDVEFISLLSEGVLE